MYQGGRSRLAGAINEYRWSTQAVIPDAIKAMITHATPKSNVPMSITASP